MRSTFEERVFPNKQIVFYICIFSHFFWEITFWDILYLEGRFFNHILELCRTRRKRLYILQEINPRWLQMKKCFFMANWGWDQKLEVKGYVLVPKVQILKKRWKKEDQCTSIFHFVNRPELPHEVDFSRNRFARNIGFQQSWSFLFWGRFWVFPKIFRWVCKHFGLEPGR